MLMSSNLFSYYLMPVAIAYIMFGIGVNLDLSAEQVAQCVNEIGVGFLFSPKHHGAMKHTIKVRKEMGVRTLFNLLGPLSNPAGSPNQLIGVFAKEWVVPIAQVLKKLGSQHVLVVHADDGLDEISIASDTTIAELKAGEVFTYTISPEQFALMMCWIHAESKMLGQNLDQSVNTAQLQRIESF